MKYNYEFSARSYADHIRCSLCNILDCSSVAGDIRKYRFVYKTQSGKDFCNVCLSNLEETDPDFALGLEATG